MLVVFRDIGQISFNLVENAFATRQFALLARACAEIKILRFWRRTWPTSRLLHKLLGYLQKLHQKFSKVPQKLFISRNSCSKVAFYQLKKSVSTTDESKSLHIYTNYLLIYIFLSTRWHFNTYRDDILVSPPVYLLWESVLNIGYSPSRKIMLFNIQWC